MRLYEITVRSQFGTENDERTAFAAELQFATIAYYNKCDSKTHVAGVRVTGGTKLTLTAALTNPNDTAEAVVQDYLASLDTDKEFEITKIVEITLSQWFDMIQKSEHNSFVADDSEVYKLFGVYRIHPRRNCVKYSESIITENDTPKSDILDRVSNLHCSETLLPEIDRIYQGKSKRAKNGLPVHYMITTDNAECKADITKLLVKSLYANGRITTGRYTVINVSDDDDGFELDDYNAIFNAYAGATIVLNVDRQQTDRGNYATQNQQSIIDVCNAIRTHKNSVQVIIRIPKAGVALKDRFLEHFDGIAFVELKEEPLFGENARGYLQNLAEKHDIDADESLLAVVKDDNRAYSVSDLDKEFDGWLSKTLRTSVYPQYLEISNHYDVAKKAKGSAYEELQAMIGLTTAKSVISKALAYYKAQKLYKDKGLERKNTAMHMMFTGNPGTAKTTVARLFAQILKDNGVLSVGNLIECGRQDLVDQFVGGTAPRVARLFDRARGSVLFIDEAYSLIDGEIGLFGDEAINTIVQEMENHREDVIVVFAGYPDKMENFLQTNPGLRSRIAFHVPFEDYDKGELHQILELLASKQELTLTSDIHEKLTPIFEKAVHSADFGNGRYIRNLFEQALISQAQRLVELDPDSVTTEDVRTLTAADFEILPTKTKQKARIGFGE
jgi:AAA+ superfamily predicted ATPase